MSKPTFFRIVDGEHRPVLQILYGVNQTDKGWWIAWGWDHEQRYMRWVSDTARRRYAYPTVDLAMESYRARKQQQIMHANAAIECAEKMLDCCSRAEIGPGTVVFGEPERLF